nr:MFS transporter [Aeromonas media]
MYLPALPQLVHDLRTDMTQVELTISTFLIGFGLGQLFWGPASDRYGRRLPIMLGIGLFILGSVGCALVETAPQMLVRRVIQALGACAVPTPIAPACRGFCDARPRRCCCLLACWC